MEYVNPIKDINKINKLKTILRKKSKRDYFLFVLGINTGLRISEILSLKISDVWDGKKAKDFLIMEENNGETKAIYLNNKVKYALNDYLTSIDFKESDYLFRSKKDDKPISRQQAYRIINCAAKEAGIHEKIGTHTLRKTFGYHAFQKGISIAVIKDRFNHKTPAETLRYLNINGIDEAKLKVDVNL